MRLRALLIVIALPVASSTVQAAEVEIPEYPAPEDNAFDYYLAATEMIPEEPEWERIYNQDDAYDLGEAELAVLDAAEILDRLRQGIGKPYVTPGDMDFSTQFPYLNGFRKLTRLLTIEAWAHREDGDFGAAFASYLDALTLGQDAARRGPLIHKLVSIACEAVALSHIRRSLAIAGGESEATEKLIGRLVEFEQGEVPLSETLAFEYDFTRKSLEKMKQDPEAMQAVLEDIPVPLSVESVDQAIEELTLYYAQAIAVARADYWRWTVEHPKVPTSTNPLVNLVAPAMDRARERDVYHQTNLRGTLVVVALELYFARHGEYPAELGLLTPDILAELPVDPCSGEGFQYSLVGPAAYTLYSVGLNRRDDGGGDPFNADPDAPDIVFSTLR